MQNVSRPGQGQSLLSPGFQLALGIACAAASFGAIAASVQGPLQVAQASPASMQTLPRSPGFETRKLVPEDPKALSGKVHTDPAASTIERQSKWEKKQAERAAASAKTQTGQQANKKPLTPEQIKNRELRRQQLDTLRAERRSATANATGADRNSLKRALADGSSAGNAEQRKQMTKEERRALKRELRDAMQGANQGSAPTAAPAALPGK